jgi:hypothetical protein
MVARASMGDTGLVGDLGGGSTAVRSCQATGALHAASGRLVCDGIRMMRKQDRRTNAELRQRIDELLARVSSARDEIVEAGLDAVHDSRTADALPASGRFTRRPRTDVPAAGVLPRETRRDG